VRKTDTHPGRHAELAAGHLTRAAELLAANREPLVGSSASSPADADEHELAGAAELELEPELAA
jgi:hypothetical protein